MTTKSSTLPEGIEVISEPTNNPELQAIFKKLSVEVPEEFLETYTEDGIEFKGYKAQYAINLLNEIVGLGRWQASFTHEKPELINGSWMCYGKIEICLQNNAGEQLFLADGVGASYAKRIENAIKGAKTSAFKNACRYLGIGNELYLAGHDEDLPTATAETATTDTTVIPNDIKGVVEQIQKATTVGELEAVLPIISKAEGKAVKELLVKKYNDRKIALSEK